eukprot:CAMPEP_0184858494 /NCGR_PEP_ID=MMETSP0580-20130426/3578_1 /TAXON_ID=1118495 /ORGANISM="Dactyliosolen fragilissimus" /LENGTH=593 /DNA_ID=CAMNT_0027354661 /DNA_START=205 /DNA_END=1986 /DNA_ORIENTATION=-
MSAFAVDIDDDELPDPDDNDLQLDMNFDEDVLDIGDYGLSGLSDDQNNGNFPLMDGYMSPKEANRTDGNDEHCLPNQFHPYILGTLIVRVVSARDLRPVEKGVLGKLLLGRQGNMSNRMSATGNNRERDRVLRAYSHRQLLDKGVANPFAKVSFGDQTQRTAQMYETVDPDWPRDDQFYFDVSLPIPLLAGDKEELHHQLSKISPMAPNEKYTSSIPSQLPLAPTPLLNVSISHSDVNGKELEFKKPSKSVSNDEEFLGMAEIDITPILTGKLSCIDQWLNLSDENDVSSEIGKEGNAHISNAKSKNLKQQDANRSITGKVRIICEYETTDPPPRPGDKCRFTGFIPPSHVFPIPPSQLFRVDDIDCNDVLLSYITKEGWESTFRAHRFMLICAERHQTALEQYQEDIIEIADKLRHSPIAEVVVDTVENLPEEGLLFVGVQAAVSSASLLSRWFEGGIHTAVEDIIYATNWDGQHNPTLTDDASNNPRDDGSCDNMSFSDYNNSEGKSNTHFVGMPSCPITGEPMQNPVVAADGHTYEKSAIHRWLRTSDKSPLTGVILPHKELVPNYALLSSLQDKSEEDDSPRSPITTTV